ncbi:hypothetical protein A9Q87_08105 [Flavobacteriales bacterium 34_180_T64]|nr:hypothetical protein A9Q87_08105 [Flavobacteriales bacterium 34_180_T64]
MKFKLFLVTFLLATTCVFSQGINYKALIKDGGGNVVASQSITIQFKILQGGSTNVYQETHVPTTDANGIIIINIGEGTIDSGVFANIDWGTDDHYLNVQINTGGGFIDMGTTQFMAVPYALTAANAATNINELSDGKSDRDDIFNGSSIFLGNDAGGNDDGTNNRNVGIGFKALHNNFSGSDNTANGYAALFVNFTGFGNTANGFEALYSNNSGSGNTASGSAALHNNGTGNFNTANGYLALYSNSGSGNTANGYKALFSNEVSYNTANGFEALYFNTEGSNNVATGSLALRSNITGNSNTAVGFNALSLNTTGSFNTTIGYAALYNNKTSFNTAIGSSSLFSNTLGVANAATGYEALYSNITGNHNTANGKEALYNNIDGHWNTAMGSGALQDNISGDMNTAIGFTALYTNTSGGENTAVGRTALFSNDDGSANTATGKSALYNNTSGDGNTAFGYKALLDLTAGSNNIAIGYIAQVPSSTDSNQIRMGNTAISNAYIQVAWDITSDKRWKENIRKLPYGLAVVKQLKPVDYIRKNNDSKTREMGFIAQDVEALLTKIGYTDQGFLHKDDKGFMSLRYNDFIALLTKAIQEQQELIESQSEEIKALKSDFNRRLKRLERLLNTTQK